MQCVLVNHSSYKYIVHTGNALAMLHTNYYTLELTAKPLLPLEHYYAIAAFWYTFFSLVNIY